MALSAIERLRSLAFARQAEDQRRKTWVLFSPIRVDLTASGLIVTHVAPFELTPLPISRYKRRSYGKSGVVITTANADQVAASGKVEDILPGEIGPILTGAYGNRGLVEVSAFRGIEEQDYEKLEEANAILFPEELQLHGSDGARGRFKRLLAHLESVRDEYGPSSDIGKAATDIIRGVKAGIKRREGFFEELQADAIAGPVPIYSREKQWLDELDIKPPENVKYAKAQFVNADAPAASDATAKALQAIADRMDENENAKMEAMFEAMFEKRARELGLMPMPEASDLPTPDQTKSRNPKNNK